MWKHVIMAIALALLRNVTGQIPDPIVVTPSGLIRGAIMTLRSGENYYAFRGIPYAEPPVNELRWQPPVAVKPWDHIFDARNDGPACHQPPLPTLPIENMSEDCLRVNVFTRNLFENATGLQPVLVHIPGGAFRRGSGTAHTIEPFYILEHNIVVVTFNYRLGSLGLLSTGTAECPGNAALKDQVEVLKWVKSHISDFGGDPADVTLSGHSAGSMSVTMHLVSPMSKDLFKAAIPMSGSSAAQWVLPSNQLYLAEKQAAHFGCSTATVQLILTCLRQQSAADLTGHDEIFYEYATFPIMIWLPVIEPDFGQTRFLEVHPTETFLNGAFHLVPIMTGIVEVEFARLAFFILNDENYRTEMENNFEFAAPITFIYEEGTPRSKEISEKLKEEFLPEPLINDNSLTKFQYLFGDGIIGFGVHRLVNLIWNHTQTHYYKLSYVGRYSHFYHPGNLPFGIDHEDELQYIFHMPVIGPKISVTDPENVMVERMSLIWSNFVKYKNPNNPDDGMIENGIAWTPFNDVDQNYLDIGNEIAVGQNMFGNRYAVWDELFPLEIEVPTI